MKLKYITNWLKKAYSDCIKFNEAKAVILKIVNLYA